MGNVFGSSLGDDHNMFYSAWQPARRLSCWSLRNQWSWCACLASPCAAKDVRLIGTQPTFHIDDGYLVVVATVLHKSFRSLHANSFVVGPSFAVIEVSDVAIVLVDALIIAQTFEPRMVSLVVLQKTIQKMMHSAKYRTSRRRKR